MRFRSFPSFTAFLLNIQYTIGYVAAGFLVSVPIQVLWTAYQSHSAEGWSDLWGSLGRGLVCLAGYFIFWPILRYYDWENMKLPEAKLFELGVTRNATIVSAVLLLLSLGYEWVGSSKMLWLLFLLEGVAYVKIKAHTLIFREFYAIEREAHRREWYEEVGHGIRAQATQVGAGLRGQAREVQGQMRDRVRRLARWMGAGVAPMVEPDPAPQDRVVTPLPCRYHGRFSPGRIVLGPIQPVNPTPSDGGSNAPPHVP